MPPNNRLAPPLRNSLASYVPAPLDPNMLPPEVSPRFGVGDYAENLSIGIGQGLTSRLKSAKQTLQDPVQAVKETAMAIRQMYDDPMLALQALRQLRQQIMSGPIGMGQAIGEMAPIGVRGQLARVSRITEPQSAFEDLWHGSPNPSFEKFDPAVQGTYSRMPALGPGHYIGEKGYAEGFVGPEGSLTKWKPSVKKSLYFDDESFTPNTPRANAANRKAFEEVKKVDPELAYRVFKFDKGRIVSINRANLKQTPEGKSFLDYSDFVRAMDIAGIDSVVDVTPRKVAQVMVRDPANLRRVE